MTLYESYAQTDYLDTVSFIAGTDFTFNFLICDSNGNPINIATAEMVWLLSPYGQPESRVFQKTATISGSSTFVVNLVGDDTIGLGGIYLQQMKITDVYGKTFRPGQGIVNIRTAIPVG